MRNNLVVPTLLEVLYLGDSACVIDSVWCQEPRGRWSQANAAVCGMFVFVPLPDALEGKDTPASIGNALHRRRGSLCIKKTRVFQGSPPSRLPRMSLSTHSRPPLDRMIVGRRGLWLSIVSDNPLRVNYQKPLEFRERGARDGNAMTNLGKYKRVSIQDFSRARRDFGVAILESSVPSRAKC